jgi:hypothetical protein
MAVTLTVNPRHRQLGGIEIPDRGRDVLHVSSPKSPARLNGATMANVDKLVFRIPAVALLASGVGLICVTPVAFAVPGLQVLYVLPLAFAVWVVRNRTTVTPDEIVARGLLGKKTVPWTDVKAVKLTEKSWLSIVLANDKLIKLPAVRLMHLPALAAVSGGRITAPTTKPEPLPTEEAEAVETNEVDQTTEIETTTEVETAEAEAAEVEPTETPKTHQPEDTTADRERANRT